MRQSVSVSLSRGKRLLKFTWLGNAESGSDVTTLALKPLGSSLCLILHWWAVGAEPFQKPAGKEGLAVAFLEGLSLQIPWRRASGWWPGGDWRGDGAQRGAPDWAWGPQWHCLLPKPNAATNTPPPALRPHTYAVPLTASTHGSLSLLGGGLYNQASSVRSRGAPAGSSFTIFSDTRLPSPSFQQNGWNGFIFFRSAVWGWSLLCCPVATVLSRPVSLCPWLGALDSPSQLTRRPSSPLPPSEWLFGPDPFASHPSFLSPPPALSSPSGLRLPPPDALPVPALCSWWLPRASHTWRDMHVVTRGPSSPAGPCEL